MKKVLRFILCIMATFFRVFFTVFLTPFLIVATAWEMLNDYAYSEHGEYILKESFLDSFGGEVFAAIWDLD